MAHIRKDHRVDEQFWKWWYAQHDRDGKSGVEMAHRAWTAGKAVGRAMPLRKFAIGKRRLRELDLLGRLLVEIQSIDHGSGAIRRIAECERMARTLALNDIDRARLSFYNFLIGLVHGDPRP